MAILAVLCLAFGVLPTYVIPCSIRLDAACRSQRVRRTGAAVLCLGSRARYFAGGIVGEFHDLGAQVGKGFARTRTGGAASRRRENPVVFAMSTSYMLLALMVYWF